MARRSSFNFMQIENGLRDALAACVGSESSWAAKYHGELTRVANALESVTAETDAAYLVWRSTIKARLLAAKQLWRSFEAIRDELGEYGVIAQPEGRVGYWEAEDLIVAVDTLIEQLRLSNIPESEGWRSQLEVGLKALHDTLAEEAVELKGYQKIAPQRRTVIYQAMHAIDDFEAMRHDHAT